MVDQRNPGTPGDDLPDNLPREPSESMRPGLGSDSNTWTDPLLRLRAMMGQDLEDALAVRSDPSAYVLRREVGHGTFGEVLEAVQVALHRVVAVKRPRSPQGTSDQDRADQSRIAELLFHKEALTTSHLDHPNIVPVYDLGSDIDGRPLLAMKLVEGVAWNQRLFEDASLTTVERLTRNIPILLLVSRAVAFAHSRGIVHRDLKPSQVMVGNFGEVYLMDWGCAIAMPGAELAEGMPASNFATPREFAPNPAGTVAYMAPEQTLRTAEQLGPWTDVYLLGGILYEILTGNCPHPQERSADAFMHAARGLVEPPEERGANQQLPGELSLLCMQALAPRTTERMQSASEFVAALEAWLSGANLREQSRNLTSDAAALLQSSTPGYTNLEQVDSLLVRALNAWAENQDAIKLQRVMLSRYVQAALSEGDLTLAGAQAERISDSTERDRLRTAVAKAERRARRHQMQRRLAIVSSLLLLIGISVVAVITKSNREADRVLESELATLKLEHELAIQEATQLQQQQTKRAEQLGRVGQLRDRTTAFINQVSRTIPLPDELETAKDWSWNFLVSQRQLKTDLEQSLHAIYSLRDQCEQDGFTPAPMPVELLMAAGTLAMEAPAPIAKPVQAYTFFAAAAQTAPHRFEPWFAMAIAGARAGNLTSATSSLAQAIPRINTGLAYFDAVSELRRKFILLGTGKFSVGHADILIEAWNGGVNHDRFQPLTSNWEDTQRLGGYKSAAPGLSAAEISGCRIFRMYEPFQAPRNYPPAVARFIPSPSTRRALNVYTTWPARANAMPVRYRIRHADGETTLALVQDGWGQLGVPNSNLWVSLGKFEFLPGTAGFVEIEAREDVRPITPQRHGEVAADAMYFATAPLDLATTAPQLLAASDVLSNPSDSAPGTTATPALEWTDDLIAAREQAKAQHKALLVFAYYPVSSIFTHPLNRFRDYCENRLFTDPGLLTELQKHAIAVSINVSKHRKIIEELGLSPAEVSLCLCGPDGQVRERLSGESLMLPPTELAAKLRAAGNVLP
ncbi:MAG: protein kinase domain-containing protein [Candidatus Sumerlaeaceae bacterium]